MLSVRGQSATFPSIVRNQHVDYKSVQAETNMVLLLMLCLVGENKEEIIALGGIELLSAFVDSKNERLASQVREA